MPRIVVTGGAGYIGSHTITDLAEHGFEVISIDNYSRSTSAVFDGIQAITGKDITNHVLDLCDIHATRKLFETLGQVDGVIHFAAFKSVGESVAFPMRYYENNMQSLFNVIQCIDEFNIPNLVFSSSCSVYGNITQLPVDETTPLAKPECAYAASKQMGEQVLLDFSRVSKCNTLALRYFNPVGAHPSGLIGEVPFDKPNNLVPIITQTAIGIQKKMFVWGDDYNTRDGSCIRDYIHVMDIARAHTLALEYLIQHKNEQNYEILNVGSGHGVSVLEAIRSFEKVSGLQLNYEIGPRRAGDVEAVYANNELIMKRLGWKSKYDLDDMMRSAWEWQKKLSASS